MTTGGIVRLIFLKDVRRSGWPLGMVLGLGLTIALTLHWSDTLAVSYVILPGLFAYLIGLFITIDVIQIDWPGRELQFLSTRPVCGKAIFFAKILFLGLFLIMGGWGLQELDYASLGVPLQLPDHLCLLVETTIHLGTAMAFVALFSLFLPKKTHAVLALGFFLVAIFVTLYVSVIVSPGIAVAPARNHAQLCWGALVFLLGQLGFIGVVLLAGLVRYRSHRVGLPIALVFAGILLDFLICVGTDKIGAGRLAHDRVDNMPPNLPSQVRLTNYSFPVQTEQTSDWNSIVYHTVVRGPNVEGVEYPYYFQVVGQQATATLRSGKTMHSVVEQFPQPDAEMGMLLMADVIGVSAAVPGVSFGKPGFTLRAFTYLPSRLPAGEDLTGVTIKSNLQLEIHRAYVAGSIPAEPGAVFTRPRQRYEITGVSASQGGPGTGGIPFGDAAQLATHPGSGSGPIHTGVNSPGGILLNLKIIVIPLTLRGDVGGKSDCLSWALVSRYRNEILQSGSGGASSVNFPIEITTSHMIYSKPGNKALPPDWLKGAELVFLGNETCGQVTVPYEVDNVTLTR